MTLHLLKMIWNRKRTNLLIVLEIFVSFLVLFSVSAFGIFCYSNYRLPQGFSYQNVWAININPQTYCYGPCMLPEPVLQERYRQLLMVVQRFDQVREMAVAGRAPFHDYDMIRHFDQDGRRFTYQYQEASDDFKNVMNLQVIRGRWFEPSDDALNWEPVVINDEFARMAFGEDDPLGKIVPRGKYKLRPNGTANDPLIMTDGRVVGVIRGYRENGEYSAPKPFGFFRRSLNKPSDDMLPWIMVKVKPGTPRSFEEQLIKGINGMAKEWSVQQVSFLEDMHESVVRQTEVQIMLAAIVAGFLMLMVVFGLLGVLWQNVTHRTTEIGLRRAQGATALDVCRQILGELFFIATLALVPGLLLIAQFPLLHLIGDLKNDAYFYSIAFSMILIYLLTFVCGLYPGWLATRIRPAEALHYE